MRRILLLFAGMALVMTLTTAAFAAWLAATAPGSAASSQALNMPAGNQPTATVVPPTGTTVIVAWPASSGGAPVAGYDVRSYDTASGAPRPVGPLCAGIVIGTSCSEAGVPAGRWRYSVVPRQQAWAGAESPLSDPVTVDPTPPTVVIAFPVADGAYNGTTWDAGCSARICGTAADPESGIALVTISIRQDSTGNYWDGDAFATPIEVQLPATGTTTWSLPFPAANFPTDGAYTVRVLATNGAGQGESDAAQVTVDVTQPAPTTLTLHNGAILGRLDTNADEVRITFSEPLNVSSICSAWSGPGDQSLSGLAVAVTVTENGNNDIVTSVAHPACTLRIGPVATGGNYVNSTTAFSGLPPLDSRVTWTASTRRLTIHPGGVFLLQPSGNPPATAVYTPDAAITDVVGNPIATTPFPANGQRF